MVDWRSFRRKKKEMPGGLWMRCTDCGGMVFKKDVEERLNVCPACGFHFTITAPERIRILLDENSFEERFKGYRSLDPLEFKVKRSYRDKRAGAREATGLEEAILVGEGKLKGHPLVFGVTDSHFIMGSMGSVVGEKIALAAELAVEKHLPFVLVCGSGGGARMEEGILSLMQMGKTSGAIMRMREAQVLFVSVLTNPVMGGTMASFAALGDILLAEPKALLGFTGPRVIQQTIKKELPKGFQRSEFLLQHGLIDRIVKREEMREVLATILAYWAAGEDNRKAGQKAPVVEVPLLAPSSSDAAKA